MAKNDDCVITDSALCKWIDKDCRECYIRGLKGDDNKTKALEDFQVTISMLPEDFDDLQGEECQFCKGEPKKRAGYALADLAHSEPKHETGMFFGFGKKVRRRIGSLMPLSISICHDCRRSYRLSEAIKWLVSVVFIAAALIIVTLTPVGAGLNEAILFGIIILVAGIGYFTGRLLSDFYVKSKSKTTRFDIFEIPICATMQDNGWFAMQDNQRLVFTKKSHTKKLQDIIAEQKSEKDTEQTSFL